MTNTNHIRKTPDGVDWMSESEQQCWFNRFKSNDTNGMNFKKFQEFLRETIYIYFENFAHLDEQDESVSGFSYQEEMQIFKAFDSKNDHILDFDEFSNMCINWLEKTFRPSCALVVVDVQNDFIDGSLALINAPAGQDGAEVVPIINRLLERNCFKTVVYTQDWHPADHIGFHANLHLRKFKIKNFQNSKAESREATDEDKVSSDDSDHDVSREANGPLKFKKMSPRARVYDTVLFDDGKIEQKLWPTHCVQDSWGAQLHPELRIVDGAVFIQKGTQSNVDAYSAFWDNLRMNETGLRQELLSRKISDVYFCGLAFDFCVAASAIDSAKSGFITYVIEDACRCIDLEEKERRKNELRSHGVQMIDSYLVPTIICPGAWEPDDLAKTKSNGAVTRGRTDRLGRNAIKKICFTRALLS